MAEETLVVDVSDLEAPKPLETVTRRLLDLKPGQKLKVIHRMFPCLLPDVIEKMHMKYTVLVQTEERVELLIEHRED
jgi:TusA-related sulfurtransferase